MTSLRIAIASLLVACGIATRSGLGRSTLFQKAFKKRSFTLGAPAPASPAAAPEAAPVAAPGAAPAGPCECSFHDMCTCESALAHLDCISKTCASEECNCPDVQFSQSCGQIASVCKPMLDISCTPKAALCDGKFYQLSSSLTGLSIDLEKLDRDAHCEASGKCSKELDVVVGIHNAEDGMRIQCFLEDSPKSHSKHSCSSAVHGDSANCTLPMPKVLPAGDKLEGWCRLVDPSENDNTTATRLTHDAPFFIYNHHKAVESKKKLAEAPVVTAAAKPPPKAADSGAFSVQGTASFLMAFAVTLC